jgi:hypothetical protein
VMAHLAHILMALVGARHGFSAVDGTRTLSDNVPLLSTVPSETTSCTRQHTQRNRHIHIHMHIHIHSTFSCTDTYGQKVK